MGWMFTSITLGGNLVGKPFTTKLRVTEMHEARLIDGAWWVGFKHPDGRFDKIASYGLERDRAEHAAGVMKPGLEGPAPVRCSGSVRS